MGTKAKSGVKHDALAATIRRSKHATSAQLLIAKARQNARRTAPLPEHAVEHLREICDYNDETRDPNARVSKPMVLESLKAHFGWSGGRDALDAVCREQLGRASFAKRGAK